MPDLPDWYQGFQLVGSDITINVNIEASDVTLPISIDAVTADLEVSITAVAVTIDINFADQAVAVWGAAAWFSRMGDQVFNRGTATVPLSTKTTLTSRTVPAEKTFYIAGVSFGLRSAGAPDSCVGDLAIGATAVIDLGSHRGGGLIFDVPIQATAGQVVVLSIYQYTGGGDLVFIGGFWGWDEED